MKTLVSVIIPVYNSEQYISECLESVLSQTHDGFEIIIVDDGSTDCSKTICKQYAEKYKNIKLFGQKHSGPGVARSRGVKEATGEYIVFLDSDDYVENTMVPTIVKIFSETEADIVRYHGCYNQNGSVLEKIKTDGGTRFLSRNEVLEMLIFTDKLSSMCFQAYRKKCFEKVKFVGGIIYCEDYLTNQEINRRCWKVVAIEDVLYHYRVNEQSTTKTIDCEKLKDNIHDRVYACNKTVDFIEENISDDKLAKTAKGKQVDRLRSDMMKLFSRCNNQKKLKLVVSEILNSEDLKSLMNRIPYDSISLYLGIISFIKRKRISMAMDAIYNRDVDKTMRATKMYNKYSMLRMLKMRCRKWM